MKSTNCYVTKAFPQRTRTFFGKAQGLKSEKITAVCLDVSARTYAGTDKGLFILENDTFNKVSESVITTLYSANSGKVYAGAESDLLTFDNGALICTQTLDSTVRALDEDADGNLWLATENCLYKFDGEKFVRYSNIDMGKVRGMVSYGSGEVFAINATGIASLHGKRPRWGCVTPDISNMPKCCIKSAAADKWGHIWFGTENGVYLYDAKNLWLSPDDISSLPKEDTNVIVVGKDGTRLFGTKLGLIVQSGVKQSFLGYNRWLPDDEVTAVCVNDDASVIWVGTNKGLSKIETKLMTLKEKEEYYQELNEKYFVREGYVTERIYNRPGDIADGCVKITDNDGLWTGCYLAIMCYKYGATGDELALERARRSFYALKKLFDITGNPGFPARAYRRPGEDCFGNGDPEWHLVKDEIGELEWKCETSSDETTGHLYGLSLFYDICANEEEKKIAASLITGLVDHILEHGYTLCDFDGEPTTWAHWGPDELNRDDKWFCEKGINSLELLSMLRIAMHVSNDEKYKKEYERLIINEHYALNCVQYKIDDYNTNHIDDNLGFLTAIPLLMYEDDPELREYFLMGYKHHWESQRSERCPLWNLAYGAITGEHCDVENAVKTLQEMPLDLTRFYSKNAQRKDIVWDEGQDILGEPPQLKEPLSLEERPVVGYDKNPFYPDNNWNEKEAEGPALFLHPYWLGRYFGLINE